ncbi:TPA: hypothetical protein ACVY13_004180 [Escherichia coli]
MSRNGANIWLSRKLNCHIQECHIGYFNEDMWRIRNHHNRN